MTKDVIISVMSQAVQNTILKAWHHDGRIEVEHSDSFDFIVSGKKYRVLLQEVEQR